jgi:asparagine synthase (glutamine-hydrolysing)
VCSAPTFRRYWDLDDFQEAQERIDYRASVERVAVLMSDAVRSHSVADVKVGSLLSGGLDSSTVTMLLTRQRREVNPVPTFSFGFRGDASQYSELPYVDALVRKEQLLNHETTFTPEWIAQNAERVVNTLEEPPLAMPAFAQFRTFELCRQNDTTVVLDGQGSDEIFAGYPYHERLLLLDYLRHGRISRFSTEIAAIARRDSQSPARLLAKAFVQPKLYEVAQAVRGRTRWMAAGYGKRPELPRNGTVRQRPSLVNQRLHHDVKWGNVKIILAYADKSAMQFSIEARVPYFDRQLIEFAFSLPAEFKVGAATRKRVLRDFARTILPAEITERTDRMGFATPDAAWLRGPLWPNVRERLDGAFLASRCFDSRHLAEFIDGFERGAHGDHRAIWRIWMLALWKQAFSVDL